MSINPCNDIIKHIETISSNSPKAPSQITDEASILYKQIIEQKQYDLAWEHLNTAALPKIEHTKDRIKASLVAHLLFHTKVYEKEDRYAKARNIISTFHPDDCFYLPKAKNYFCIKLADECDYKGADEMAKTIKSTYVHDKTFQQLSYAAAVDLKDSDGINEIYLDYAVKFACSIKNDRVRVFDSLYEVIKVLYSKHQYERALDVALQIPDIDRRCSQIWGIAKLHWDKNHSKDFVEKCSNLLIRDFDKKNLASYTYDPSALDNWKFEEC